jgi:hypothetical protein
MRFQSSAYFVLLEYIPFGGDNLLITMFNKQFPKQSLWLVISFVFSTALVSHMIAYIYNYIYIHVYYIYVYSTFAYIYLENHGEI